MKLPPGGNGLEIHHQPTSRSKIIEVFTNQIPTLPLQAKEKGDIVGCSGSNFKCCGLTREREARGQIGVRRVLVASDEAAPIPGLRHAIFPYWPGWRLPEPEPAISFLPGVARQPRKLHMWRSCGFPGASLPPDPSLLSTHIHTIWNNTNRTEMDCTTHRPCTTQPMLD